jgi:hypothetical protein
MSASRGDLESFNEEKEMDKIVEARLEYDSA